LSMAAGCIEDDLTPNEVESFDSELTLDEMEDQDWYDTEEERLKNEKT